MESEVSNSVNRCSVGILLNEICYKTVYCRKVGVLSINEINGDKELLLLRIGKFLILITTSTFAFIMMMMMMRLVPQEIPWLLPMLTESPQSGSSVSCWRPSLSQVWQSRPRALLQCVGCWAKNTCCATLFSFILSTCPNQINRLLFTNWLRLEWMPHLRKTSEFLGNGKLFTPSNLLKKPNSELSRIEEREEVTVQDSQP